MRPSIWALVRLEPLARKLACSVLREEGGREAPDLPGCVILKSNCFRNLGDKVEKIYMPTLQRRKHFILEKNVPGASDTSNLQTLWQKSWRAVPIHVRNRPIYNFNFACARV